MPKALSILFGIAAVVFAVLYFTARRPQPVSGTGGEVRPPAADEEYLFVGVSVGNAYWIDARSGCYDAGKDLGVKATFDGPQGSDVNEQVKMINAAVARGVKGIIVSPAEPQAVVPAINRAVDAGIPVITVDTDSPNSKRYTFIGTGNYQAGLIGGKLLGQAIGRKAKVALLTIPGQWNLEERVRGYREALKEFDIQVVQVGNDRAEESQAAAEAKSMLQANQDLAGFGCVDAAGGVGAAVAVRDAGKKGENRIIAMDRNDATLEFIKKGFIQASLAQRTYTMAYLGMQMLYDLQHNRIQMVKDWRKANTCPLPTLVDTGTVVITPENVEFFYH